MFLHRRNWKALSLVQGCFAEFAHLTPELPEADLLGLELPQVELLELELPGLELMELQLQKRELLGLEMLELEMLELENFYAIFIFVTDLKKHCKINASKITERLSLF